MNHADIDPSLRAAEPVLEKLDDGFSPPSTEDNPPVQPPTPAQPALGAKSPF